LKASLALDDWFAKRGAEVPEYDALGETVGVAAASRHGKRIPTRGCETLHWLFGPQNC